MSRRNFGGFLSANEQATDSASANGIYTLSEAQQKTALGVFPTGRWTPQRSVRFKGTSSYFTRSLSGSATKFTFSCWVKRSRINNSSTSSYLYQLWNNVSGNAGTNCLFTYTGYTVPDSIYITWDTYTGPGAGYSNSLYTTSVFRDPSAWYHVVIAVDTAVPTFLRAFKIYVNGVQQSTTLSAGAEYNSWSSGLAIPWSTMNLGAQNGGSGYAGFYDGYWSENVFVDGQALTPSSFGFTDPETGTWVPKRYTGSYGTNGYYLPFNDATSTTTIGYDRQLGFTDTSKNNFTSSGISVTPGTTYDSMVDVPGIPSVTSQPDIGGVQRGNYCTLNSVDSPSVVLSNGNLQATYASASWKGVRATMAIPKTGKWKWEVIPTTMTYQFIAVAMASADLTTSGYTATNVFCWYLDSGEIRYSNNNQVTVTAASANDVCEVRIDNGVVSFYRNNVLQYTFTQTLNDISADYFPATFIQNGAVAVYNFGQRPFTYTPTGYKSLCTTNLPTPVIKRPSDHFDIKTWTGTAKAMTITNTAKQSSTHQVPRSLRFRNDQSPYLTRTLTTPTDNKKWTFSCWFKRAQLTYGASGAAGALFYAPSSGNTFAGIYFTPTDIINWYDASGGATVYILQTSQVFRDPTAWYHLICAYDSSQTDAVNRQKMYINGVQITAFSSATYVSQNTNGRFNSAVAHDIGRTSAAGPYYYDGYLAEVNFIDGQQLTPSSFGNFDSSNNWLAKKYTGTYGTNGFYLPFNDPTSTTTIGYDRQISLTDTSKNNFTSSGIYLTSTAAANPYDAMYDSPTDYDDGTGNPRGNYSTFSPQMISGSNTIDSCNLRTTCTNASGWNITSSTTQFPANGKWYCEFYIEYRGDASDRVGIVVTQPSAPIMTSSNLAGANNAYVWDYAAHTSGFYNNGTFYGSGAATYGTSDLIGMAYDGSTGSLWFGKQTGATGSMVWANSGNPATGANPAFTGLYNITPGVEGYSNAVVVANFGQRPWSATPPTGFVGLNTKSMKDSGSYNLPDNFGNFVNTPDLVVLRSRSTGYAANWFDTARGPKQTLDSTATTIQSSVDGVSSFLPNGFELGTSTVGNNTGSTYVGWGWNKSQTPGFDIVPYSGTGSNLSVPHSLGATPKFIIVKALGTPNSIARSWFVYHADQGPSKYAYLNATSTFQSGTTVWQGVAPDSSNFYLGTEPSVNWSGAAYIAYLWAEVPGYSKIGSWTNNNSNDGTFVYTGFRPKFLILKNHDNVERWFIQDSVRSPYNYTVGSGSYLVPSDASTEGTNGAGTSAIDFVSNGFKIRSSNPAASEISFGTRGYIYAAFAEAPFKYANAR